MSGYAIDEGVVEPAECDALLAVLSAVAVERSRAGARHLMRNDSVVAIANDPRLIALAKRSLGRFAVPFRATLFEKSSIANWLIPWHQDTALPLEERIPSPEWTGWSEKAGLHYAQAPAWALERIVALRLQLDDSTSENGPLCVVPNSHLEGILPDELVPARVARGVVRECLSPKGGVISMRLLLLHASSKARNNHPRRVLHFEYADSIELRPGIRLAIA